MKKFTIEQYAALAGSFLLFSPIINAQVVYTDIIPDLVLENDLDFEYIDMDNDGVNDFGFLFSATFFSGYTATFSETVYQNRVTVWCGPALIGNVIAGDYRHNSSAAGTTYLPYALQTGELINAEFSFQAAGFQLMGMKFQDVSYSGSAEEWVLHGGEWGNISAINNDLFLGVKFKSDEDCAKFGWIRCVAVNSLEQLVIKDYAFESICGQGILAGDTISYVGIENNSIPSSIDIVTNNNQLAVQLPDAIAHAKMYIVNINGELVVEADLKSGTNNFYLNLVSGIYVVDVSNGVIKEQKKIIILD
jgi:hypothetical protein